MIEAMRAIAYCSLLFLKEPIFVKGEPLGLPIDIMIHYGENMQDIIDELKAGGIELPPMVEA